MLQAYIYGRAAHRQLAPRHKYKGVASHTQVHMLHITHMPSTSACASPSKTYHTSLQMLDSGIAGMPALPSLPAPLPPAASRSCLANPSLHLARALASLLQPSLLAQLLPAPLLQPATLPLSSPRSNSFPQPESSRIAVEKNSSRIAVE